MKLFFDARYIRTDFHDGISRYSAELGTAVARATPVTFLIYDLAQLTSLPHGAAYLVIHPPTSLKEPLTARLLNRYQPDVVFSPMQTIGSQGRNFKLILTLHDMIYYKHRTPPRHLSLLLRTSWRVYHASYWPQRLTLNRADIINTVSETSKQEIMAARLTKRPVVVVPNAPQDLGALIDRPHNSSRAPKNLVYMGSFMPYKNVETLIAATAFLPGYRLHLLSRITPERKHELTQLVPAGADVRFHGGISDKAYASLLADNAIMVSASLSEGYGLPLAEALQLGVPAVVSDMPIFHEVAGKGALYFNPDSPGDLAKQISALTNTQLRKQIVTDGQIHIKKYNWDSSAQTLLEVIRSL